MRNNPEPFDPLCFHSGQSDSEIAAVRRALITILQFPIRRLLNLLHAIIERKLLSALSEPTAHINTLQFAGFRCFPELTTLRCTPVTLLIGKNNTGKSNILEAFRLCAADALRSFLLERLRAYGREGIISGLNYIFSSPCDNYYYPPPMTLGFKMGATVHGVVITRHSPFLLVEWYGNQERLCTLVSSDNLAKTRFNWGNEPVKSLDGRSLTAALDSKVIESHFDKLRPLAGNGLRIVYHRSSRDDRNLIDDLEARFATQFSRAEVSRFLSKVSAYFGIPPLQFIQIMISNRQFMPTPRDQDEAQAAFRELNDIRQLVRDFRKHSHKKKLAGKILTFVDELANSYDPSRPSKSQPGAGGLMLERDHSSAKDLGSGFRAILLLCFEIETNDIILIDEPESFLHPSLQSRLASYIVEQTGRGKQFVIASHSEVFLNAFFGKRGCSVIETQTTTNGCKVREIQAANHLSAILDDLGLKASYLLQSNALIWVEGPSDRVYIKHWIECWSHGRLQEGVHYHCLSYGGRLLSHFSAAQEEFADPEKIAMLRINRHAVVVLDSDRRKSTAGINDTKRRVIAEVSVGGGLAWITHGRSIENYIPIQVLQRLKLVGADEFGTYDGIDDLLAAHRMQRGESITKVELARRVSQIMSRAEIEEVPNLRTSLNEICSRILRWNDLDTDT